MKRHRDVIRKQKEKQHTLWCGWVYFNAGNCVNELTDAGIAGRGTSCFTLNPTTRGLELESGARFLLTDTVGPQTAPYYLIEALKSTLEEARYSDMILHVVDCSNPNMDMQMPCGLWNKMKVEGLSPLITVFNNNKKQRPKMFSQIIGFEISAKTGEED